MTHTVVLNHTFETAHRLPQLEGKCVSLHGHSWSVEVGISAPAPTRDGTVVEFGEFKGAMRTWIDDQLDHGTMLGAGDPLISDLARAHCKVFVFGVGEAVRLPWPTVENVAELLARVAQACLDNLVPYDATHSDAVVTQVTVTETANNSVTYNPRLPQSATEWLALV